MLLLGGSVEWLCRLLGQRNLFGWVMGGIAGVVTIFYSCFRTGREEEKSMISEYAIKGKEVSTKRFFRYGKSAYGPVQ